LNPGQLTSEMQESRREPLHGIFCAKILPSPILSSWREPSDVMDLGLKDFKKLKLRQYAS